MRLLGGLWPRPSGRMALPACNESAGPGRQVATTTHIRPSNFLHSYVVWFLYSLVPVHLHFRSVALGTHFMAPTIATLQLCDSVLPRMQQQVQTC